MSTADTHSEKAPNGRVPENLDGLCWLRGVCHDVGQELAVVQTLARLATLEAGLPEQVRQRLETIGEHAAYVAQMLRDSVEGITNCSEFDLAELVSRIVADVRLRTQTVCLMDARPLRVVADRVLLRRAVGNLLDNAVRAAGPEGMVLTRVRCDGDLAVVEIEDDGPGWGHALPGIASLGLGVAHNSVAAHGGDLALETGQLGGALVRLWFPAGTGPSSPSRIGTGISSPEVMLVQVRSGDDE